MNHYIFLVILLVSNFGCKPKKNQSVLNTIDTDQSKVTSKRTGGKFIVSRLEQLGYFNLTQNEDLKQVKADFEKNYLELDLFQGPTQEETLSFKDNRYYRVDCEELFEAGGLITYLEKLQPVYKRLGIELAFGNEKSKQTDNEWIHTIELNEIEYVAFNGQFSVLDWGISYVNFIEMLNAELIRQEANNLFYPIRCGNDGMFVLMTKEQFAFVQKNYPQNNEHPKTIEAWKTINGVINTKKLSTSIVRRRILDSVFYEYDYPTILKKGFKLEYKVYVEAYSEDTLQTIFLKKGEKFITDLTGGSNYHLPHKNIGYVGADFDNSFAFVQSFGAGNPHIFQLIEKQTGREMFSGIWVDVDINEQLLLYLENSEYPEVETLKLCDVRNGISTIIEKKFEDSECIQNRIGGLRNCIEIDKVTEAYVSLKTGDGKTIKYKR